MNFFNDRDLARRFRDGAVPSRERLIYLLILLCATSLLMSDFLIDPDHYDRLNQWDAYSEAACFLLAILGAVYCYRVNSGRDDREFIERFVCIAIPVAAQTVLAGFVVFAVVYALSAVFVNAAIPEASIGADFVIISFMIAYFYARLAESIKIAAGDRREDAPAGAEPTAT